MVLGSCMPGLGGQERLWASSKATREEDEEEEDEVEEGTKRK
jgi:hypothetical protein